MSRLSRAVSLLISVPLLTAVACSDGDMPQVSKPDGAATDAASSPDGSAIAKDPATAEKAVIDRFTDQAGMLQRRSASPSLPGPNQAVNFDQGPFITQGLGPRGEKVRYYNFDVQPTAPAPIYVLFHTGQDKPVSGQLNIVDVAPGDAGYSDFWQVQKVTVPATYVANSVTSRAELTAAGFAIEPTQMLVNCPIVPDGSTATLRLGGGSPALMSGWYKGKVVKYFSFEEKALTGAMVPVIPIYVAFNVNPNQPGGGPGSGFRTETGNAQTHNVITALPTDGPYSPLWSVSVYDNTAFASVTSLATATAAPQLGAGVANVNCPVVEVQ
jgi:hypothetical protein